MSARIIPDPTGAFGFIIHPDDRGALLRERKEREAEILRDYLSKEQHKRRKRQGSACPPNCAGCAAVTATDRRNGKR